MTGMKGSLVRKVRDVSAPDVKDRSARNQLAWTVAGLALLALLVILRVLFPPPALAESGAAEPASDRSGAASAGLRLAAGTGAGAMPGVAPWQGQSAAPLPATAAEAERAQEAAAEAAARAVGPQAPANAPGEKNTPGQTNAQGETNAQGQAAVPERAVTIRPDYVSALEWQVLQGVAAKSRDPARTLAALVAKLRFSKQLELFRGGASVVPRADLAAQLLADLPARVAAGDMARDEALRLLPALVEPLEPDPASRAVRVRREAAKLPGQALKAVP